VLDQATHDLGTDGQRRVVKHGHLGSLVAGQHGTREICGDNQGNSGIPRAYLLEGSGFAIRLAARDQNGQILIGEKAHQQLPGCKGASCRGRAVPIDNEDFAGGDAGSFGVPTCGPKGEVQQRGDQQRRCEHHDQ